MTELSLKINARKRIFICCRKGYKWHHQLNQKQCQIYEIQIKSQENNVKENDQQTMRDSIQKAGDPMHCLQFVSSMKILMPVRGHFIF